MKLFYYKRLLICFTCCIPSKERKLIAEELRKSQKLPPSRIPSSKGENRLIGYHQTIFSRVRVLMLERDRLASSLFT